jgi:acetylornithine deacetylase/succinyl-diaminopimelate desuccinylase-like protein
MFDPVAFIRDYARYPSVSTDPAYADGMRGARDFVAGRLKSLGFNVEEIATPLHPVLLATLNAERIDWPHVVLYGHYDVQPANPDSPDEDWARDPFEPAVVEGRLYARGAADNKGPQGVQLAALSAALEKRPDLPLRITFLIEGEEEMGSPSMPGFLEKYADRLRGDLILLSDTGSPSPEQIVVTTGLRGIIGLQATLHGPKMDLHSGVHGGGVPNPIAGLTRICASLHNDDGSVNVPGFYDGVEPPAHWEREELAKYPTSEAAYREFLGVEALRREGEYGPLECVRFRPTLEFNGIGGGYQGAGSKTVLPAKAFVKITCRTVANQDAVAVREAVARAMRERVPEGFRLEIQPVEGGDASVVIPPDRPNTPVDQSEVVARAFRAADRAITDAFGRAPLYLREGGSVPIIGLLKKATGMDSLMIGLFTPEDNLHAPNESFHLGIMENGIAAYTDILLALGDGP